MENIERNVEYYLVKTSSKLGFLCYKFTSPTCAGVCDRILIKDGRVFFVELKRQKGKLSPLQIKFQKDLLEHGVKVYVLNSKEAVDEFFKEVCNEV